MTAADILKQDADVLGTSTGLHVEVIDAEGRLYVRVADYVLPSIWAVPATPLLIIADHQYPHSALDMFWTDQAVVLADGSVSPSTEPIETYLGQPWRRFSWHGSASGGPAPNPLLAHFAMIEDRLAREH